MARLIFSINKDTAAPFNNKWPGWNHDYVETSKLTKTVTLGDGTETTIEVDHANPDFYFGNPINSSCRHMGDVENKSYFAVRDSSFVTWTDEEKTEYGYVEESLPLSEADTNLLIVPNGLDTSNTEIVTNASNIICKRFLNDLAANTVQAQADAEAYGYNFANNYTFNG
tara:strand:+ start:1634 stop:2140 length:507 start_codon:yes stop_codon:yes gene_type:complete